MRFNKTLFFTTLILATSFFAPQLMAYDIKCKIISGPTLKVNGAINTDVDLNGEEFSFSKDPDTNSFSMDLPTIGETETSFESSNFDTSPQRCSPFFRTRLNDNNFLFTIDLPLTPQKAALIFDNSNNTEIELDGIIRAKGSYSTLGMNYIINNKDQNASAKLTCKSDEMTAFIAELQKKCSGIYTAYQKAKSLPAQPLEPIELAFNQGNQAQPLPQSADSSYRPNLAQTQASLSQSANNQ